MELENDALPMSLTQARVCGFMDGPGSRADSAENTFDGVFRDGGSEIEGQCALGGKRTKALDHGI